MAKFGGHFFGDEKSRGLLLVPSRYLSIPSTFTYLGKYLGNPKKAAAQYCFYGACYIRDGKIVKPVRS